MPDKRHHRGKHPDDERLFAPARVADLRRAVSELSWLLTRGYALPSAVKVVGDRYNLDARQRMAVTRASCTDDARAQRMARNVSANALRDQVILIDGYNVLTTIEAALAGGVILHCRDSAVRDIASIHGTYRKVEESTPALHLLTEAMLNLRPLRCDWLLDSPVSNSGRLKATMGEVFAQLRCSTWKVEIVQNPDAVLSTRDDIVVSADSVILDRCRQWFNLAAHVIENMPFADVIDLRDQASPATGQHPSGEGGTPCKS